MYFRDGSESQAPCLQTPSLRVYMPSFGKVSKIQINFQITSFHAYNYQPCVSLPLISVPTTHETQLHRFLNENEITHFQNPGVIVKQK